MDELAASIFTVGGGSRRGEDGNLLISPLQLLEWKTEIVPEEPSIRSFDFYLKKDINVLAEHDDLCP